MEENSKSLKVKAFYECYETELENQINRWLNDNDVTVLSIKYSSCLERSDGGTIFSALIVYRR